MLCFNASTTIRLNQAIFDGNDTGLSVYFVSYSSSSW